MTSPPSLEIRPIVPADAEAAARLSGEFGYPTDATTMRQRIEQLSASADHGAFVACQAGQVVGWIHVSEVQHLQSDPRAEIGGLVVEDAREAGVACPLFGARNELCTDATTSSVIRDNQPADLCAGVGLQVPHL